MNAYCLFQTIKNFQSNNNYSQTCVQRPPLGPQKSGRCLEVAAIQKFLL
jgi:hypothetical protein